MTQGTELTEWNPDSGEQLPAHLLAAQEELGSNIADRASVPSLSYSGKVWSMVIGGDKTVMQRRNADGDLEPVSTMRMVILNYNNFRGRAFYQGTYNPQQTAAPDCWSADGERPDSSVKEPQNPICNGCPQSIKGSKIVDGREMIACSSHRMLAIAPANDLTAEPLRLKIAVTSDYDKQVVEHGWFALRQYTDYLKSKGVTHSAMVVTKVKFDSSESYPKLLFALDRPLSAGEIQQVKELLKGDKVDLLLSEKWTAAGSAGKLSDESDIAPHGLEAAYIDGWQAHPDDGTYSYKGDQVMTNVELAAKYPEPEAPSIPASEQVIDQTAAPAIPQSEPEPEAAAVAPALSGLQAARADGWAVHPDNPAYYFKDTDVVESDELAGRYPAAAAEPEATSAPAVPAAPAAAPPEPESKHDPIAAAEADGWVKHPEAPEYHYKGEEVVLTAELSAKYPPASGGTAAPSAPATTPESGTSSPSDTGTTAATASPTEGAANPELDAMLDKWTS